MAHFASRKVGPKWFTRPFPSADEEDLEDTIHEGSFGTHANGHSMAKKMLRAGYYWLTMEYDCYKFAKKCHKCQIYAEKIHVPRHFSM